MVKDLPNQETLKELIEYNSQTGKITWKKRDKKYFTSGYRDSQGQANNWNSRYSGKEAFTAISNTGGLQAILFHKHYLAHRVIWKLIHGEEADNIVHINGDKLDNRLSNLTSVERTFAHRDISLPSNNTSGIKGVFWEASRHMWRAELRINGKTVYLGRYKTKKEAAEAREIGEARLNFNYELLGESRGNE